MKVLNEKGVAAIKGNLETEQAVIDFLFGLCGVEKCIAVNEFGVLCGQYMALQKAKKCICSSQVQNALETVKCLMRYNIKRIGGYECSKDIVFTIMGNDIYDYEISNIHQWLATLKDGNHEIFKNSFVLRLVLGLLNSDSDNEIVGRNFTSLRIEFESKVLRLGGTKYAERIELALISLLCGIQDDLK
jgi:hypothetical protein